MKTRRRERALLVAALIVPVVLLASCSGGGGGGSGGGNALIQIAADGATGPLWELVGGVPSVPPVCPAGVFVNARFTFTFDGPVSAASIPGAIAFGSINIVEALTNVPAQGTFTVEDDPAFPAGNHRRVVFVPALPGDPGSRCVAGVIPQQSYTISVPAGSGAGSVLVVGGAPIAAGAVTCFNTCGCPTGGGCASPFTDPVIGAPFVTATTPATSDPAPPGIDACAIAQNTIQIHVNEPLDPSGIDASSVKVMNLASGAQVPGYVVFTQATSPTGACRIEYVATNVLPAGVAYQVLLGPGVKDFGGNPLQTSQSNPAALLYFQTAPVPLVSQPPLVESFDTPNPGGVTGTATWSGNGQLQATMPIAFTGTGADGAFNPPAAQTTIMDTAQLVNGQPRKGVWNFTSVNIPATAIVRCIGPYQVHLRCTGSFTLNGAINANAAAGPATSLNQYDQGPGFGWANGSSPGGPTPCQANGGVGNAGGGAGGTGSGVTPPPGSPPFFQCTLRALKGENGFGPTIDGATNDGSTPNAFYAGGQGGDSGCFPATTGLDCNAGDLGGLGGAGGTAGRVGEPGIPRNATAACDPNPNVVQPIAQPSPVAMIPPIGVLSAGSGGGGGGDHLENVGTPPSNDDQGAGGGGGGGGLRISCVGPYIQTGSQFNGIITARGAQGNTAQADGGGGGSGSGGEVWIQSFSTVTITPTSIIDVTGPGRSLPTVGAIGCSNHAAGGGGPGLVQIEAAQGPTPTVSFDLQPPPTATTGAVFSAPAIQAGILAQAQSDFRYTGSSAPDYTGVVEVFNLGDAPGATITITYEGAHEAVNSAPGNPVMDPATIKNTATGGGPITAANLDELDGYPFIRFRVILTCPTLSSSPNPVLPSVDSIAINFSAQATCP